MKFLLSYIHSLEKYKLITGLIISIIVLGAGFLLACELASHEAAAIFNRHMQQQTALQGAVTAEKLSADMWGNVYFTNLKWQGVQGELLADVKRGRLKVSAWDVVWNRAGVRSIHEVELDDADINLSFDENMHLDVIPAKARKNTQKNPSGKNMQFREKLPKLKLILRDTKLSAVRDKRLFVLDEVNGSIDLREDEVEIHLSSGEFGGSMIGDGCNIDGTVQLTGEQLTELNLGLYNVVPDSLGLKNVKDAMTLTGEMTGPIREPVIEGAVSMKELNIPNLSFTKINGLFHYANGLISLTDVTGNVFGGTLDAYGLYHFDNRSYKIRAKCDNLSAAAAAKNTRIQCSVDLDINFHQQGHPSDTLVYGYFETGKGSYMFVPFKGISGIFTDQNKELAFANVVIRTELGDVESNAFKIVDGKVVLSDIFFVETDGRRTKIK